MAAALLVLTACGSDKPDEPVNPGDTGNVELTADNVASWTNYMRQVSSLLVKDADNLRDAWTVDYNGNGPFADQFKNHTNPDYSSARDCIEEVIDKCASIADEVGHAKIGDPYALYMSGNRTEAVLAVESWYSWHSRDDYTNNIRSIRNAYLGSLDGTPADASIHTVLAAVNPDLDARVLRSITAAANAIQAIQQPFRNNIGTQGTVNAMTACADLENILDKELKPAILALGEQVLQPVVVNYVDAVVVPTYVELAQRNRTLQQAVRDLCADPTSAAFERACALWISAREPWECSEAFLFGPVDALGLDPNMDSWPLDRDSIIQILNSGQFDNLDWTDGDDDDAVEAKQGVRGFHTLEFLLFADGKPRTVNF